MLNEEIILTLHNELIDTIELYDSCLVNDDFINAELTKTFIDTMVKEIMSLGDNK